MQVAQLEEQQAASKEAMEADIRARHEEAKALKAVVDELRNATCNVMGSEAAIVALQVLLHCLIPKEACLNQERCPCG